MSFWETLRHEFDGQQRLARLIVNLFWSAIAVVLIALAVRVLRSVVRRGLARARVPVNVIALSGNGITVAGIAIGFSVILSIFGVPPTAVFTTLSLATAGIVFAFQDVLKNFIAGIYLLVEHPFTIGEHIRVRDAEGVIEGVNIRTTALKTDEGAIVLVPNNIIFTEIVTNRSVSGIFHAALTLTNIAADTENVETKARETVAQLAGVATQPEPRARILAIADGTAQMQVDFWYLGENATLVSSAIDGLRSAFPDVRITVAGATTAK